MSHTQEIFFNLAFRKKNKWQVHFGARHVGVSSASDSDRMAHRVRYATHVKQRKVENGLPGKQEDENVKRDSRNFSSGMLSTKSMRQKQFRNSRCLKTLQRKRGGKQVSFTQKEHTKHLPGKESRIMDQPNLLGSKKQHNVSRIHELC